MNSEQLKKFSRQLKAERERLRDSVSQLENSGLNDRLSDSVSELSAYDNHPADLGSETFERGKDIALRDNQNILLKNIEHALTNIKKGIYGYCDICGSSIPVARLEILPWATTCVSCQAAQDEHDVSTRPVEEYLLSTPFDRTFLDGSSEEFVGFDGEDSWQAVARYGSSDTPQDLPGTHDYKDLYTDDDEQAGIVDPIDTIPAPPDGSSDHTDRQRTVRFSKTEH